MMMLFLVSTAHVPWDGCGLAVGHAPLLVIQLLYLVNCLMVRNLEILVCWASGTCGHLGVLNLLLLLNCWVSKLGLHLLLYRPWLSHCILLILWNLHSALLHNPIESPLLHYFFLHFHLVDLFFIASCRHSWKVAPQSNSRETGMADFLKFSWSVVFFLRKATSTPILTEGVRPFVLSWGLDKVGV